MRFAVLFPMRAVKHYDRWRLGGDLAEVGRIVESAGFDGFAMSEHPFPSNDWLAEGGHHAFDPFVSLAYIGAATRRLQLMTYVMVAGYRNPYLAAKAIASLDVLSGGRAVVGLGAGYLRPEFEALGADFVRRGAIAEEAVEAMRAAWSGRDHDGPFFPARGHRMLPDPVRAGGPPIWIGGNSAPARRRAVASAEGWIPMGVSTEIAAMTGTPPLENVAQLGAQVRVMQEQRERADRPPLHIAFTPFEADLLREGAERYADLVATRLPSYVEAGIDTIVIEPVSRNLDEFRRDVEILGKTLISTPVGR
ncbi:TIGR03619 family F420-dependent LLM class oxidoreductase [Nocardia aurea]|uniref:TIGR03619 family F420-dependent LLM class oxidoreductase n=1 Tax=Nocardia aurea TaxID=2144174 RepID=UPI000D693203|nr:TIGR03619 family F420-dependent LLM class oxidoreductase [Nocardia aurea]